MNNLYSVQEHSFTGINRHTCIHICTNTCICVHAHTHNNTCTHACTHWHAYVHTCIYTLTNKHTYVQYVSIYTYTQYASVPVHTYRMNMHKQEYTHTYICMSIYMCTYAYKHEHICTQTRTHKYVQIHTYMCAYAYTCICIHTNRHICKHKATIDTGTYIHSCTHNTYTYILASTWTSSHPCNVYTHMHSLLKPTDRQRKLFCLN